MALQCGAFYVGSNNSSECSNHSSVAIYLTKPGVVWLPEYYVELYLITAISLIGIIGNLITLIVLHRARPYLSSRDREHRRALYLLQVLAVCDAIYLLICILKRPTRHLLHDEVVYEKYDLYVFPAMKTAQTACIWIMVLVTTDRYINVCMPLRALDWVSPSRRQHCAIAVLVASLCFNMPRFFDSCVATFIDRCSGAQYTNKILKPVFNNTVYFDLYMEAAYMLLLYIGPLTVLLVLNCRLIHTIKSSSERQRSYGSEHTDTSDTNATLVLVVIVMVFILCQTPELVTNIISIVDRISTTAHVSNKLLKICKLVNQVLAALNSAINFFIYVLFGKRFRQILKETFCVSKLTSEPPEGVPLHSPFPVHIT